MAIGFGDPIQNATVAHAEFQFAGVCSFAGFYQACVRSLRIYVDRPETRALFDRFLLRLRHGAEW